MVSGDIVRKVLWGVVYVMAGTLGLATLAAFALRLYYDDERLRQLSERWLADRLATSVAVGRLSLSLWSGIQVEAVEVGALPGFAHETLAFDRLALRWSPLDLLLLCVHLDEVALTGVRVALEENASGSNLDQLVARLKGPRPPPKEKPAAEAKAPPPPAAPTKAAPIVIEPVSLPVRVRIDRFAVSLARLSVERSDLNISFEHAGLEGRFDGQGEALWVDLWLGLGERADPSVKSSLHVRGQTAPLDVDSEQRLDVHVQCTGLGDLHTVLALVVNTELGRTPKPVPPVSFGADLDVAANLLAERLNLNRLSLRLNDGFALDAALSAQDLLAAPSFAIRKLAALLDLGKLAPLVAGFAPKVLVGGRVELEGKSTAARAVELALKLRDLRASLPGTAVSGVSADGLLRADSARASVSWRSSVATTVSAGQEVKGLHLTADVTTPLAPWLGGAGEGAVEVQLRVDVAGVSSAQASLRGVALEVATRVPVALVRKTTSGELLTSKTHLRLRDVTAGGTHVQDLDLTANATLGDLAGNQLDAELSVAVRETALAQAAEPLTLRDTRLTLAGLRRQDDFVLRRLRLTVADALAIEAAGEVAGALGSAPRFSGFGVKLTAEDLGRVLAGLPPSLRPLDTLSGRLGIAFHLDGRVPYRDLMRRAAPPRPPAADVAARVQAYADYLETWRGLLAHGLPFTASVELLLGDVALANRTHRLAGLALTTRFDLTRHGPELKNTLRIGQVMRPVESQDITHAATFVFNADGLALTASAAAKSFGGAGLAKPARDSKAALSLRYRVGGDLLLDELSVASPDLGVLVEASGVVSKPLRFALTRGWSQPGLPGMDTELRFKAGIDLPAPASLVAGGPELAGAIDLGGSLRAAEGVVALAGLVAAKGFGVRHHNFLLHAMSGGLPFEVRVVFDPRDDATVLRRNLALGSGVFAVLTSADDISQRPARPDYYDRLRPYRQRPGLTIARLHSGSYEVDNLVLEGRLTQGMLLFDSVAMHVLGGDIAGNLALQLGRDGSLRGDLNLDISNVDASYFKDLNLKPGVDSELNADLQVGFLLAPKRRDLTLNMNVTKIGSKTLDRFLQLLDPGKKNEGLQNTRGKLWLVRIDNVAAWIRYENFNMDLMARPFLRVYPTIDRELLRRYSLSEQLDAYVQPHIDQVVAPLLGWAESR